MTYDVLLCIIQTMIESTGKAREHKRDMLRNVFFADVDEFRRRVAGDFVLVNYWNKAHKKWAVAIYKKENYIHQFNEEEAKALNLEEVGIVTKGVLNLYDHVMKGTES